MHTARAHCSFTFPQRAHCLCTLLVHFNFSHDTWPHASISAVLWLIAPSALLVMTLALPGWKLCYLIAQKDIFLGHLVSIICLYNLYNHFIDILAVGIPLSEHGQSVWIPYRNVLFLVKLNWRFGRMGRWRLKYNECLTHQLVQHVETVLKDRQKKKDEEIDGEQTKTKTKKIITHQSDGFQTLEDVWNK